MPIQPRRLDSQFGGESSPQFTPEAVELDRKTADLECLELNLAEAELELATCRGELAALERRYMYEVGRLYAQLDDVQARIADAEYRRKPTDDSARTKAQSARNRATESAQAVDEVESDFADRGFDSTETLGKLYREAARKLHPDLTTDPDERMRRKKAMVEVNRAYEEGDERKMQQILDDWRVSPDQVLGEDTVSKLIRVIRTIALVEKRLVAVREEITALQQSDLFQLQSRVEEAAATGRDLLSEMAERLRVRIAEAKAKLRSLLST